MLSQKEPPVEEDDGPPENWVQKKGDFNGDSEVFEVINRAQGLCAEVACLGHAYLPNGAKLCGVVGEHTHTHELTGSDNRKHQRKTITLTENANAQKNTTTTGSMTKK